MELSELKIIDLKESILADNDADAEKLRKETADQNVYYINVMSSPGAGKTTMLRDLTRSLSDGSPYADGKQICVIDERSELAGCYMGVPQNHIGIRTDVLDACPKADGMMMAIRSMGPEILVVDELGLQKDYEALDMASVCGIRLLASVHGNRLSQILAKENTYQDVMKRIFQRIILLKWRRNKDGEKQQVWNIYDMEQRLLAEKGEEKT